MADTEVVLYQQAQADLMPALSIDQAVQRRDMFVQFVSQIMRADVDFGKIPGTQKDVLLKPGAEKLCSFFGLSPEFVLLEQTKDWTGLEHGGEPLFEFVYKCRLSRNGRVLGEGDGSCNSWETKYRYRKSERVCPQCGQAAIIKGKEQYGGGWLCFAKKGGCGAKFAANDSAITEQETGRVLNTEVAEIINTLQKMAQKRALIAASLLATNASEFFTQDLEDMAPPEPAEKQQPKPTTLSEETLGTLQRNAAVAAAKGTEIYQAFFMALRPSQRKALADSTHGENKQIAAQVDALKATQESGDERQPGDEPLSGDIPLAALFRGQGRPQRKVPPAQDPAREAGASSESPEPQGPAIPAANDERLQDAMAHFEDAARDAGWRAERIHIEIDNLLKRPNAVGALIDRAEGLRKK